MNILNLPATPRPANSSAASGLRLASSFFLKGSVFTVIGQIQHLRLGWAGRMEFELHLSIGVLTVRANRDTMPELGDNDWARVKIMHRYDDSPSMHVLSAIAIAPAPGQTSWVPVALYHRSASMRELRRLLSTLEPGLQGAYMTLMLDYRIQRQFFWRPAALDHGCYPGALLDESVRAAALAYAASYDNEHDRGLCVLASLLWDLGKVWDPLLREDHSRGWPELQPHPKTLWRLKRPLELLEKFDPPLARELAGLLAGAEGPIAPITHHSAALRRKLHRAVHESWGPIDPSLLAITTPGVQA